MKKTLSLGIVVFLLLVGGGLFWVSHGEAHPLSAIQEDLYTYLPVIFRKFVVGPGDLYGYVFNASSKVSEETGKRDAIANVEVCLDGVENCVTTNAEGEYSFSGLTSGGHVLTLQHDDYYPRNVNAFVQDLKRSEWNIGLVGDLALGGELYMRVTLEWDNTPFWYGSGCDPVDYPDGCPSDMDAHIWASLTHTSEHNYQDFEGDCQFGAAICMEASAWNGPGPETVAVTQIKDPNSVYYYGVHHYYATRSGVPNIYQTGAFVRIFQKNGFYEEVSVSEAEGSGNFWYVFSMNAQGDITYQNCIIPKPQGDEFPACPPTE